MAQLKDLIVSGDIRCLGKIYASELVGNLTGTADRAIADGNGANIANTYIKGLSVSNASGSIITYTRGDNTTGTIDPNTNFIGTRSQWNALSTEQKSKYRTLDIIDDYNEVAVDSTPSPDSDNVVSSAGVYNYINQMITQAVEDSY